MDDTRPFQLYVVDGTKRTLVARGTIFEATTILHGMELSDNKVNVTIEEVLVANTLVFVPTDHVYIVTHTF